MSLIKDVKNELKTLDVSAKKLRFFAIVLLVVIALISYWQNWQPGHPVVLIGGIWSLAGMICPRLLKHLYYIWMFPAMVVGWFVSRLILAIIYYLLVTPIAFIARLTGKTFLDVKGSKPSYWVSRKDYKPDYTKMS